MSLTKLAIAFAVAGTLTIGGGASGPGGNARRRAGPTAGSDAASIRACPAFPIPTTRAAGSGFEAAYCRALAAAVLGDAEKVSFVTLTGKTRFPALASGEVDILSRNTTWTFSRDGRPRLHLRRHQLL